MLLPFQGATATTRDTQGVASLALGYVLHWAFSPHLLNPKLELVICSTYSFTIPLLRLQGETSCSEGLLAQLSLLHINSHYE